MATKTKGPLTTTFKTSGGQLPVQIIDVTATFQIVVTDGDMMADNLSELKAYAEGLAEGIAESYSENYDSVKAVNFDISLKVKE